jgi:hypothetical protein
VTYPSEADLVPNHARWLNQSRMRCAPTPPDQRSLADGYAALYPSYGLPSHTEQIVGWVKEQSDVPIRSGPCPRSCPVADSSRTRCAPKPIGQRTLPDGYAALYPSYGLPSHTEQIVGWVKEQSDVPIKANVSLLTGTLRFTRPTACRDIPNKS